MVAVEGRFEGGPIDGRITAIEATAEGLLPAVVTVPQTGIYAGPSDIPAPAVEHMYARIDDSTDEVVYQYRGHRPLAPK